MNVKKVLNQFYNELNLPGNKLKLAIWAAANANYNFSQAFLGRECYGMIENAPTECGVKLY